MSSRRRFLKTGVLLGGATLVGGGLLISKIMPTRAIAEQLVYFLDYPEIAAPLGQGFLDSNENLRINTLAQMTDKVLQNLKMSEEQLPEITRNQLLEILHRQVRSDFVNEQVVFVNGWLLSRTEAQICALHTLLLS